MEKEWLNTEKLVHLFEKSLNDDCKVEHDINLPDLSLGGNNKRQCDIVIYSGKIPRQTITIVEVQNRKSKFDLTTFQGLIQKMRDVGAQHLICVSTSGFSKTIVDKASQSGGTVRLITLRKDNVDNIPINFFNFTFIDSRPIYNSHSNPAIHITLQNESDGKLISTNPEDLKFIVSDLPNIVLDYKGLANFYFNNNPPQSDGIYNLDMPSPQSKLFLITLTKSFEIDRILWKIHVTKRQAKIEVKDVYSYEQNDSGPISWILEGKSTMDNITNQIRLPIFQNENGGFQVKGFEIISYPEDTSA